jgi:hypothetical protein
VTALREPVVLLILGCPRSGTTIVARAINASPDAAIIFEYSLGALTRDLAVLLGYGDALTQARAEKRAVPAGSGATRSYDNRREEPDAHPTRERFGHIIRAVVEATLGKRDVRVIGSKTPGAAIPNASEGLEQYFADVRSLFVLRNPLDTINSMMNQRNKADETTWSIRDVGAAIAEYRRNVLALLSHAAASPGAGYAISYDDLADRTVETLASAGRFLGVDLGAGSALVRRGAETKPVLSAAERTRVERAFTAAIGSWKDKELTGPAPRAAAALHDCVESAIAGRVYRYEAASGERAFLGAAWHELEAGAVWSSRPEADLFFTVEQCGEHVLSVELSCYLAGEQSSKKVGLELNGATLFSGRIAASAPGPHTLVCAPIGLEAGRVNRLVLRTDDVRSPAELGVSGDRRALGLYLHGLRVDGPAARG